MPDDSKRVPFTSMIYMGDGLSDVPCMKMMRAYGGQAIAVYQASNRAGVEDLLAKGRVDFIFQADYRAGYCAGGHGAGHHPQNGGDGPACGRRMPARCAASGETCCWGRWACSELDGKETAGEGAAAPSPEKCLNPWDFSLQSVSYLLNYTLCI